MTNKNDNVKRCAPIPKTVPVWSVFAKISLLAGFPFTPNPHLVRKNTLVKRHFSCGRSVLLALLLSLNGLGGSSLLAQDTEPQSNTAENADADAPSKESADIAAELAERKLEKSPQDEKTWGELVEARARQHDFKNAEKAIERWRSKVANPGPAIDNAAGALALEREDFPAAVEAFKRFVQRAPEERDGWNNLGVALGKVHDWSGAMEAFSRELRLTASAGTLVQRARCRIRLHDWSTAATDVRKANEMDATNAEVTKVQPVFERSADWLPKVKALDAAIQKKPSDVSLLLDRAELLLDEGLISAGKDDIEAALKLRPESLRARFWAGALAWDRNEKEKAGEVMEMKLDALSSEFKSRLKTLDSEPNAELRAQFLLKHGQPLLALHEVRGLDNSVARAQAFLELKRLAEAGEAAKRAVEAHPKEAPAWLALANVEFQNGNFAEASEAAKHSLQLKKTPEAETVRRDALQRLGKK